MPRRYLLALAIIAILFFVGIGLLISFIARHTGGSSETEQPKTTLAVKEFTKSTDIVSYSVYGPVVADEERRVIRITVSATDRRVEVLKGYYETVIKSQTLPNNQAAYDNLLPALQSAGFDNVDTNDRTDEKTLCTTGERYVMEAKYQGKQTSRGWTTSCSQRDGNFLGDQNLVETLMQAQIPNYSDFTSDVDL